MGKLNAKNALFYAKGIWAWVNPHGDRIEERKATDFEKRAFKHGYEKGLDEGKHFVREQVKNVLGLR